MNRMLKHILTCLCAAALMLGAAGCSGNPKTSSAEPGTLPVIGPGGTLPEGSETPSVTAEPTLPSEKETAGTTEPELPSTEEPVPSTKETEKPTEPTKTQPEIPPVTPDMTNFRTNGTNGYVIVIDPGHQGKGNNEQEPVGPGATETKAKVSSGTASRFGGRAEYQVNLEVALKLREELLRRGYTVIMTRTGHNVNISNIERAEIANGVNADAFLRIHCNGSEKASVYGISIYYQTPANPYNGPLHDEAKALNQCLLDHMLEKTGARNAGLIESDTYSGINWCKVPAGLIEMGYMTNREEDAKLQDGAYQTLLAQGMADGVDAYLAARAPRNK